MAENEPPTPKVRKVFPVVSGDAIAELRAKFVASLYCTAGAHESDDAYSYGVGQWCPEHPAPTGLQDALEPGLCQWSKPHYDQHTRLLPGTTKPTVRAPRRLCRVHLAELLADFWRRGDYGRQHG